MWRAVSHERRVIRYPAPIAIALVLALGFICVSRESSAAADAAASNRATAVPGDAAPRSSLALEADAISFFIGGYSGIVNLSLRGGFQVALGTGRYDVPGFLLEGDDNYDAAEWTATATSVQVLRVGYRFNGPLRSGPAVAAVVLNQNWRLRSEPLGGETRFRPVSVGLSAGYYFHIGPHFYVYPTVAFTNNWVSSGDPSIHGTGYRVEPWAPNGSVHAGWEWAW